MRNLARGMALTMVALVTLVPIQATPALALDGTVNVEPETASRVTGSTHTLTATITGVTPLEDQTINFEWNPANTTPEASCETDTAGTCAIEMDDVTTSGTERTVRAYHMDGSTTPCGIPIPTSDCDNGEGQDEAAMGGTVPEPDDTDVVTVEWLDGVLDVEPEDTAVAPGAAVTLEAAVMSEGDEPKPLQANVDAEITEGPDNDPGPVPTTVDSECDTDPATGICELTYTVGSVSGVDEVTAWVDRNDDPGPPPEEDEETGDETEGDDFEGDPDEGPDESAAGGAAEPDETDVVRVSISGGQVLILAPTSQTKIIGSAVSITATVTAAGTPQSGIKVAGQVLTGGAHPGQLVTCSTGANGVCTLTYPGTNTGTDKLRAAVDTDGNGQPNEADATEDAGAPGGTAEPDPTAIALVTWTTPAPPPAGAGDKSQCDKSRTTAADNEILVGTKDNDKICGYDGNDAIRGLGGNDKLKGGAGNDKLKGGAGNDRLSGQAGNDKLNGGSGNDKLKGQAGKDTSKGGKGEDRCGAEKENKSCEK